MAAQYHLNHGVPKKLFDGVAPSAALNSDEYGVQGRVPVQAHRIRWRYLFGTNPTALSIKLQGSLNPNAVSPEVPHWFDLDTKATLTGDSGEVEANVLAVRGRVETVTGGAGLTLEVMV